ncbi:single-stranded-DNA-specific exonuclease RecJ [Rummeliibacillus sp. NPDC094406]|uniref:single-stranded-DNA-specific exonuclease RecJ n=1 Tax=Rummeliibacillus sp. NPDC094406 TaxID=3364511 RepID=UPI00381BF69F
MTATEKRWRINRPDEQLVKELQDGLKISSITAKILVARGFNTVEAARDFLTIDENAIHDPFELHGMKEAVELINKTIQDKEKILVYGDYDADGITSTTVMKTVLQDLGADISHMIPNRFTDGYGPSERLFRQAYEEGFKLIITVDNGIAGNHEVQVAKDLGMDVIITDHHEPGEILPPADVIIHPRHPEGHYPFGELAGVGVAFKVAHALYGEFPKHLVEIVAIGTIADLVPLLDENRYLVKAGIEALQLSTRPAVKALCKVSGTNQQEINEETIGFGFAPRLNALGRLGDAAPGVDFLMAQDTNEAISMANYLNEQNKERQAIVTDITEQAIAMVENDEEIGNSQVLVIAEEGWNPGVVGIVASRLVEKYYRPTIILSIDVEKGTAKGSARSIEGFHMYKELSKNREILPAFGGHPMAAGMTLAMEDVDELRYRLDIQARECLTEEDLIPVLEVDIPLTMDEIDIEAIEDVRTLAPFGTSFAKPMYAIEDASVQSMRKIGANEDHIKLQIGSNNQELDAVGFHKGYLVDELTYGIKVSFAGDLQINEWNGRKKPQLMLQDVKTNEWQLFDLRGIRQVARWLQTIPLEEVTFLAFREATISYYESLIPKEILEFSENISNANCRPYVVLLDLPQNVQILESLLICVKPTRIYAHFYIPDSHYFDGMPTREQFVWYYSFLRKRQTFQLRQHLTDLAKHKGWSRDMLIFMTQVFFELGFVTIENGLAKIVDDPPKKDLTSAKIYQERSQQMDLEQTLLYAPYKDLRDWFDLRLNGQAVSEEEQ